LLERRDHQIRGLLAPVPDLLDHRHTIVDHELPANGNQQERRDDGDSQEERAQVPSAAKPGLEKHGDGWTAHYGGRPRGRHADCVRFW
jgi:hypothetical protein